jgi:hypothetical protein
LTLTLCSPKREPFNLKALEASLEQEREAEAKIQENLRRVALPKVAAVPTISDEMRETVSDFTDNFTTTTRLRFALGTIRSRRPSKTLVSLANVFGNKSSSRIFDCSTRANGSTTRSSTFTWRCYKNELITIW